MAGSGSGSQPRIAQISRTIGYVVEDVPRVDLESYIQNYRGRTRVDRLLLIASTSTVLSVDALKVAIHEIVANGRDVQQYRNVWEELRTLAPTDSDATFNRSWVEQTERANETELRRLESELKGYKNNLVKESIRMGNEDLAKFLESTGEMSQAYEVYAKMRSDVSTTKHITEVGLHLARIAVHRRDWGTVVANMNKISGIQSETIDKSMQSICNILYGIAQMRSAKYAESADHFLQVDPSTEPSLYDEYASPNDIATYGGLLALATMSRTELSKFLETSNFRAFLELEPHIRRAITQFVNGRYSACLAILESYKSDYFLDIYLQHHVNDLYQTIRGKCIYHFLQPFSCVTIDSMNAAFAQPGESIEDELEGMIRTGNLLARIDAIDRVVTTTSTNQRAKMQAASLAAAKKYEQEAVDRIRRIGIISADLEVKGKKSQGHFGTMQGSRWAADAQAEGGFPSDLAQGAASSFVGSQY